MFHKIPQGLPKRLHCLTGSPPGHVPPIIPPFRRKARGAISELHEIYGTVAAVTSLLLPPIVVLLQRKNP